MKLYTNACAYNKKEFSGYWNKESFTAGDNGTAKAAKDQNGLIFFKKVTKERGGNHGQK